MTPNRRFFLAGMAATGIGALAAAVQQGQAEQPETNEDTVHVDVAVVGAGFSGLAATERLAQRGLTVALLDAKDRIGGRAETVNVDGAVLDLGAGWITDPDHNHMLDLAARFGVKLYPQFDEGEIVQYDNGKHSLLPPLRISPDNHPAEFEGAFAVLRELDRLAAPLDVKAPWTFPLAPPTPCWRRPGSRPHSRISIRTPRTWSTPSSAAIRARRPGSLCSMPCSTARMRAAGPRTCSCSATSSAAPSARKISPNSCGRASIGSR